MIQHYTQNILRDATRLSLIFCALFFITPSAIKAQSDFIKGVTIEFAERFTKEFNQQTCENLHPRRNNDLNKLLGRLDTLGTPANPITVRVVFQQDTNPSSYECILTEFKRHNYQVMGLMFDSDALATYDFATSSGDSPSTNCSNYDDTKHDYKNRVKCYVAALNPVVDIWEAGNEVNGEWADKGCVKDKDDNCISNVKEGRDKNNRPIISRPDTSKVVEKIKYAVDQTATTDKPIALTLIHQPDCTSWDGWEMFDWFYQIEPLLPRIKYLLVSYYEDNCNDGKYYTCDGIELNRPVFEAPKTFKEVKYNYCLETRAERAGDKEKLRKTYWNIVFDNLHRRATEFNSNIKIGFGEVGCKEKHCDSRFDFLNRYYSIRAINPSNPPIMQPWFVGGYFWWTTQPDILKDGGFYPALQTQFRNF